MERNYKPYEMRSSEVSYKMPPQALELDKLMTPFTTKSRTIDQTLEPIGIISFNENQNTIRFDLLNGKIINTSDIVFQADLTITGTALKEYCFDGNSQNIVNGYRLTINKDVYSFNNINLLNEIISDYMVDLGYKQGFSTTHEQFSNVIDATTLASSVLSHGEPYFTANGTIHVSFNPFLPLLNNQKFYLPTYGLERLQLEIILETNAKAYLVELLATPTPQDASWTLTNAKLHVPYIELLEGEEEFKSGIGGNMAMIPYFTYANHDNITGGSTERQIPIPTSVSSVRYVVVNLRNEANLTSTAGRNFTRREAFGLTEIFITSNGVDYPSNHLRFLGKTKTEVGRLLMNNIKGFSKINNYTCSKCPRLSSDLVSFTNVDKGKENHVDFIIDCEMINNNGERITGADFSTGNSRVILRGAFTACICDIYVVSDAMLVFDGDASKMDIKINNSFDRKLLLSE